MKKNTEQVGNYKKNDLLGQPTDTASLATPGALYNTGAAPEQVTHAATRPRTSGIAYPRGNSNIKITRPTAFAIPRPKGRRQIIIPVS
jgi:hypothetical protein